MVFLARSTIFRLTGLAANVRRTEIMTTRLIKTLSKLALLLLAVQAQAAAEGIYEMVPLTDKD